MGGEVSISAQAESQAGDQQILHYKSWWLVEEEEWSSGELEKE